MYRLRAHEIPESGRNARGTAIINLLQVEKDERIQATLWVDMFDDEHYLFMATRKGTVKKTLLSEYDTNRSGLIAVSLDDDDELVGVVLTNGNCETIMATRLGQAIRFHEENVRAMGRSAHGVKGIKLEKDDWVVGFDVADPTRELLVVTTKGYGKRTPMDEYRITARGGKGIRTMNVTHKNGEIVGLKVISPDDDVMFITKEGILIQMNLSGISEMGRATQGVRLMKLEDNDELVALTQVVAHEGDEEVEPES
jgi:DNA gyrase subunit A